MVSKRFGTELRKEQIAQAALEVVRSGGIRSLSVSAVAEKVGIVPSAIYRHYKSKGDIIGAVLELIQTRLNANFRQVVELECGAVQKLHMLLSRHVELIHSNHAIPKMIFSGEVLGDIPGKQQQLYGIIESVTANIASIVAQGQQNGAIRGDIPANHVAVAFLGMIQPAALIWSLSRGEFDLLRHSRQAWKLFSASIQANEGE